MKNVVKWSVYLSFFCIILWQKKSKLSLLTRWYNDPENNMNMFGLIASLHFSVSKGFFIHQKSFHCKPNGKAKFHKKTSAFEKGGYLVLSGLPPQAPYGRSGPGGQRGRGRWYRASPPRKDTRGLIHSFLPTGGGDGRKWDTLNKRFKKWRLELKDVTRKSPTL